MDDIDRGLRKLLERRGLAFVVYELLANAWDAASARAVEAGLPALAEQRVGEWVAENLS